MTYNFGDSFDPYTVFADMGLGYWDTVSGGATIVTGRFTGSRGIQFAAAGVLAKSSGTNDAVHHFAISFEQTTPLGGTTVANYIALADGSTFQCTIDFRSDGTIELRSGNAAGTVLDSWSGAFTGNNIWYAFEIEVVINNTTGSWAIRRGGNTVNDHALGGLNTRGGTTNNYANKVQIGQNVGGFVQIYDDFYWQSGSATGNWLGDLRCLTRMPASDNSIQFSRGPYSLFPNTHGNTQAIAAGTAIYVTFTPTINGTLANCFLNLILGYSGNMKCTLFNASGGNPSTVVASANAVTNPVTGSNTFTFSSPPALTENTQYFLGFDSDTSAGTWDINALLNGSKSTTSYASFPVASPAIAGSNGGLIVTIPVTPSDNWSLVNEAQEDAGSSYVYDSNPGDADFYGVSTTPVTPASVIATTVRMLAMKSDTGSRTAAAQLKSGATTVAGNTLTLTNSGWQWSWRTDLTDPNTGSAWTSTGVNNALIGPKVVT